MTLSSGGWTRLERSEEPEAAALSLGHWLLGSAEALVGVWQRLPHGRKQVGDFVFPCQPLTQPRAPAGERRRAPGGLRGSDPAAPVPPAGAHHSLGSRSTSGWAWVPHAFPEASSRGLPVDRWAAHSFPGWYAEDPECHKTGSRGEELLSPVGRAAACARSCPRGHIWAWALFRCAHTCANRRAQGATLDCPPRLSQPLRGKRGE